MFSPPNLYIRCHYNTLFRPVQCLAANISSNKKQAEKELCLRGFYDSLLDGILLFALSVLTCNVGRGDLVKGGTNGFSEGYTKRHFIRSAFLICHRLRLFLPTRTRRETVSAPVSSRNGCRTRRKVAPMSHPSKRGGKTPLPPVSSRNGIVPTQAKRGDKIASDEA